MYYGSEFFIRYLIDVRCMKRKTELLILILVIMAILLLTFVNPRFPHFIPGNEWTTPIWCGVLFVENLPDPHTEHESKWTAQASLRLDIEENGSIYYRYPFVLGFFRDKNFRPVNPYPELLPKEGYLLPGDENEVYDFVISLNKAEDAPKTPIEGDWKRITINKEGKYGVVFSSNNSLIISREFDEDSIDFYVMQTDNLEENAKKYYNLSKGVNYIDGNRVYLFREALVIL